MCAPRASYRTRRERHNGGLLQVAQNDNVPPPTDQTPGTQLLVLEIFSGKALSLHRRFVFPRPCIEVVATVRASYGICALGM